MMKTPGTDWKLISSNKQKYLDKLCKKINDEVMLHLLANTNEHHKKYIETWRLLRKNDEYIQAVFDGWKRSRFYDMVAGLIKLNLLGDDIDKLSNETKAKMIESYGFTEDDFLVPF